MNSIVLRKRITAQARLVTVTRTRSFHSRKYCIFVCNYRNNASHTPSDARVTANRSSFSVMSCRSRSDFIEHCWSIDSRNRLISDSRHTTQYVPCSTTYTAMWNIASLDSQQNNFFSVDTRSAYYHSNNRNNSRRSGCSSALSNSHSNSADEDASVNTISLQSGEIQPIIEEIKRIDTSMSIPRNNILTKRHRNNTINYHRLNVKKHTDISMNSAIKRTLSVRYFSNRSDNKENENRNENENENRKERKNGNESTKVLLRHFLFQIHPDYFQQVQILLIGIKCFSLSFLFFFIHF